MLNAFGTVPRSAFFGKSSGRVDVNSFGVCWNSPVAMSASSTCEAHGGLRWQRPPGASRSLHPHRAVTAERRPAMLVVSAAAVWAWATVERPRSWGGVRVRTEGPWSRGGRVGRSSRGTGTCGTAVDRRSGARCVQSGRDSGVREWEALVLGFLPGASPSLQGPQRTWLWATSVAKAAGVLWGAGHRGPHPWALRVVRPQSCRGL